MSGFNFPIKGASSPPTNTVYLPPVPNRANMLQDYQWGSALSGFPAELPLLFNSYNNLKFLNLWCPYNTAMDGGSNVATVSFGGFTTAPDGTTNTAQLMVENTNDGLHFATAGYYPISTYSFISTAGEYGQFHSYGLLRLAGFFKSSNRRIILELSNFRSVESSNNNGAQACFDLVHGTVAFSGAYAGGGGFGPLESYTQVSAQIRPYPNGWYLCWMDVFLDTGTQSNFVRLASYLDNGTATLGSRPSYTGDGSSGVYGWLTNLMPTRSWGLNSTAFFDDFTSLATIDGANGSPTYSPGFNWYNGGLHFPTTDLRSYPTVSTQNPSYAVPPVASRSYSGSAATFVVSPATSDYFAQSGSILTLQIGAPLTPPVGVDSAEWFGISSLAWNGQGSIPGATLPAQTLSGGNSVGGAGESGSGSPAVFPGPTAVGTTWTTPAYFETKCSYYRSGESAFWTRPAETLFDCFGTTFNDPLCFPSGPQLEIDWWDTGPALQTSTAFGGHDSNFRFAVNVYGNMTYGIPDYWYDPIFSNYSDTASTYSIAENAFYTSPGGVAGIKPPNSPWEAFSGGGTTPYPPIPQAAAIGSDKDGGGTNPTETLNVYGFLLLPHTATDNGFYLTVFNGVVTMMYTYAPTQVDLGGGQPAGNTIAHVWTDGKHYPIFLGSGSASTSYDYVMVIQ